MPLTKNQKKRRRKARSKRLGKLYEAITSRNIAEIKDLLAKIPLFNSLPKKLADLINKETNPNILLALLTAGFHVPELAHIFYQHRNNRGMQILLNLLPQLSIQDQEALEGMENLSLDKCMLRFGIPILPVRIDRMLADFRLVIDACKATDFEMLYGNLNKPMIEQLDFITLDLQYLSTAKNALSDKYLHFEDNDSIQIQLIEESNQEMGALIDLIKNKMIDEETSIITSMIILICCQLSVSNIPYCEIKLNNNMGKHLYYSCLFINLLLGLINLALMQCLYSWHGYINDPLKFHVEIKKRSDKNLLVHLNELDSAIENNKAIKFFDFVKTRQTLPSIIAEKFHHEYAENKPPGLLFWKQAFEERAKLNTTRQSDNDFVNAPVLRLTS